MSAFIQGLKEGELHASLIKKAPRSFDDLLQRATKYVNLEEAVKLKKGENSAKIEKPREADSGKKEVETRGRAPAAPGKNVRRGPRYDTYTPLVASHERVLMDIWEHPVLRWPSTWAPQPKKPMTYGNGKLCKFHNEYGHGTEECSHLRDEIERLVRENRLNKYVARQRRNGEKIDVNQEETDEWKREELPPRPPLHRNGPQPEKLTIHMIDGGPTEGDSNNARRTRLDSIQDRT